MSAARKSLSLAAALAVSLPSASAVTIELDYTYDSNSFFAQAGSREALRAAADFYESVLTDSLSSLKATGSNSWGIIFYHPGTDAPTFIANPIIPKDTIRIYVGGFDIPGGSLGLGGPGGWDATGSAAWLNTVDTRNTPGGGTTTGSDFTPWGGSIAFDTATTWDFSLSSASGSGTSFVSTALHEIAHVLGTGSSGPWDNLINASLQFTGPQTVARFGSPVPVTANLGHFRDDGVCDAAFTDGFNPDNPKNILSRTFAMFGTPAGRTQIALMDPSDCSVGDHIKVVTELDLAVLDDIGWDVTYPASEPAPLPELTLSFDPATRQITLTWPTTSGHSYQLQKRAALTDWADLGDVVNGSGYEASLTDDAPPENSALYRILVDPTPGSTAPPPLAKSLSKRSKSPGLLSVLKSSRPARICRDCTSCSGR